MTAGRAEKLAPGAARLSPLDREFLIEGVVERLTSLVQCLRGPAHKAKRDRANEALAIMVDLAGVAKRETIVAARKEAQRARGAK